MTFRLSYWEVPKIKGLRVPLHFYQNKCVVPENIHTSPLEGIFFLRPPNPLEIPLEFHTYIETFWSYRTSRPQEIPIPSVGGRGRRGEEGGGGGVSIFSGTTHCNSSN